MTLSSVLFLRALLFFALATSLVAGNPVPLRAPTKIRLVDEDMRYLIRYAGLNIGWNRTRAPPDQDASLDDYRPGRLQIYFQIEKSGNLGVRFGRHEGNDLHLTPTYRVSQLKPNKAEDNPFNLIRGSWYRERCVYEVEEDLKKADAIEITSEGKELYVRRKEKID